LEEYRIMAKTVAEIMTANVEQVAPADTISKVAQAMKRIDVGSIPVVDGGAICGLITDRDIVLRVVAAGKDPAATTASEIMSGDVVCAAPDWDVSRAAKVMADQQIRRLPVVDKGALVGMLSLGDVAVDGAKDRVSGEALSEISEPARPQR
jgi:CBS domain-containing protein